jgi:hypothetical protein
MAAASNCARSKFALVANDLADSNRTFREKDWTAIKERLLPAAGAVADAETEFYEALVNAEWPGEVQKYVDTVAELVAADAADWQRVADAATAKEVTRALQDLPDRSPASSLLRAKLGLETNIGDDADPCGPTA